MTDTAEWSDYLAALLRAPDASVCHEIGAHIAELGEDRDRMFEYVNQIMTENPAGTRAFEVAWDICALRVGLVAA